MVYKSRTSKLAMVNLVGICIFDELILLYKTNRLNNEYQFSIASID